MNKYKNLENEFKHLKELSTSTWHSTIQYFELNFYVRQSQKIHKLG